MSLYHDVMEALTPLIEAFDQLGIAYYIGGSVSSSLHGMARQSQDVDVIADIKPDQVRSLVQALQGDYYLDEQAWQAAIRHGTLYNVIHLNTMLKVDLIPLKRRAFTREEARRAQPHLLEAGTRPVKIASAEDAILTKLEWFDMGGRSSGRQWNDIQGIMSRQGAALDLAYLRQWADTLRVRACRCRPQRTMTLYCFCSLDCTSALFMCLSCSPLFRIMGKGRAAQAHDA